MAEPALARAAGRAAWKRALDLLDEALERPAAERGPWLAGLGAEPAEVRAVLERLLHERAALETGHFLDAGAHLPAVPPPDADATLPGWLPGQTLGPWRLVRALGRGGMASVWLAERADAAHQRAVALKLPHTTPGNAAVIGERFLRERRILSTLRHPHIAQVLDAGSAGAQPWLAMEFVDGQPITRWADERQLGVRARLRLFVAVLGAVQHAHAQLVIHRDIKPANVLVDTEGQVKLLDFGVAKLLQSDGATADTALTQLGGRAMTPQYASPEQIGGQALGTASDVYSLGVLLYELLTGQLPYVLKRASAAALEEAIVAAQVRRPSQVVLDRAGAAAPASRSLARSLRGDIDTVVMKALQAAPQDRYASAAALAEDIERVLAQQPIKARPDSLAYRLRKLWARQKLALLGSAAVLSTVLAALALALWQARLAQQQSRQAEAVQQFLASTLAGNDPQVAQGRSLSARELLDRSAARIESDFAQVPAVRARLNQAVGGIYIAMGDIEAAAPHVERALAQHEALGREGSEAHLETLFMHHEVLIERQQWPEALRATERAITLTDRHAGAGNRWAGRLRGSLAWVALKQGRIAEAVRLAEEANAMQRSVSGESSKDYLFTAGNLSIIYVQAGELMKAAALSRRTVEIGSRLASHETTDRLVDRGNLGHVLGSLGDHAAALAVYEALMPELRQHLGDQHDRTVLIRSQWAQALAEHGRFAEALAEQRANLEAVRKSVGADDEAYTLQQAVLGRLLRVAGQAPEALPLSLAAAADFERRYAEPTWYRERSRWLAGEARLATGQVAEGLADLHAAQQAIEALLPLPQHWVKAEIRLARAVALRAADPVQARALADEACAIVRAGGENNALRLPRCRVLAAWIAALAAPAASAAERGAAHAAFVEARTAALAPLPALHPLRAELLAAEAEILQRAPESAARGLVLQREADALHRAAMGGLALPQPLRLVH